MVKQKKQIEEGMEEFMQQVGTMRFTTVESVWIARGFLMHIG